MKKKTCWGLGSSLLNVAQNINFSFRSSKSPELVFLLLLFCHLAFLPVFTSSCSASLFTIGARQIEWRASRPIRFRKKKKRIKNVVDPVSDEWRNRRGQRRRIDWTLGGRVDIHLAYAKESPVQVVTHPKLYISSLSSLWWTLWIKEFECVCVALIDRMTDWPRSNRSLDYSWWIFDWTGLGSKYSIQWIIERGRLEKKRLDWLIGGSSHYGVKWIGGRS